MQLRFESTLTFDEYVTSKAWEQATLDRCPLCPPGTCSFHRLGTYLRKVPAVAAVARFYCPEQHTTFGLLPDFYASRFPGTLDEIERTAAVAEAAPSVEQAVEALRPADAPDAVTLPAAIAWLRRRLAFVRRLLVTVELARATKLPLSTVHRILSRAGVMAKAEECATTKDRRHFAYEKAGELWMSDVMHGPAVVVAGRRKHKTYLIGLLDDATRLVPYAAFALSENTGAYLPILRQAVMRRGIPLRLYVDNGAAFRSHHLALVCARLGITLIHARPYQPAGKGKQERFFRTVRMRFLPALGADDLASLDALNRRFWAWVEGEYHRAPHRGLDGRTPLDAWAMRSGDVRAVGPELDLAEMCLLEVKRKVHKDRTLSLDGVVYEVSALLVGEMVTVRFDPAKKGAPVDIWLAGKKIETARVVDAYANCFVKRNNDTRVLDTDARPPAPPRGLRLRDLDDDGKGPR